MPDRLEHTLQQVLIDILDGDRSNCRNDMHRQRREPTAGFAVTLQFRLARLKAAEDCLFDREAFDALSY